MSDENRIGGQSPEYGLKLGDVRNLRESLESDFDISDGVIDTVITSPPYADVKNYEADEEVQIGFGQSYDDYLEDLRDVYGQVYDATKDTGSMWIVVNTIKKDGRVVRLPFDIADICENLNNVDTCEECGNHLNKERDSGELVCPQCNWRHDPSEDSWKLQDIIVWDKNRARPWSRKGQLRNVFEYILCFSKTDEFKYNIDSIREPDPEKFQSWWVQYPERYNPQGKVPHNIWEFTTPTQGSWGDGEVDHPAPFPSQMVERIIHLTTDPEDVVLDPFAGTGIVLAQAEAMGRRPLGFELSEEYAEMYKSRREEVIDEWNDDRSLLEAKQEVLQKVICQLRQLKYPRELTRRVRKELDVNELETLGINTVFQLSHDLYNPEKFDADNILMETDTVFVIDNDSSHRKEEITNAAVRCASVPPCSKFGIKANVDVATVNEMQRRIESDNWEWGSELYLYTNDKFNDAVKLMELEQWYTNEVGPNGAETQWRVGYAKNNYPPIFSNLEISIPDPEKHDDPVDFSRLLHGGVDDYPTTLLDFLDDDLDMSSIDEHVQTTLGSEYNQ